MTEENNNESKNYQEMLQKVEGIIHTINNEEIDLDAMVNKVEEGYQLIKAMRDRLNEAKGKIENLQMSFTANDLDEKQK